MQDKIPSGLKNELARLIQGAAALLLVLKNTKTSKDKKLYTQALIHFRNTTARISCRLDTMSYFCTKEVMASFLRESKCFWDRKSGKVVVDSNDVPQG
jgi:hypothetical protein